MEGETSVEHALPRGARLAEYEILDTLGIGGFGITYRARDTSLDRDVVIKENLPSMYAHRNSTTSEVSAISKTGEPAEIFQWSLNNFIEEAKMLARFDHPNLVKVHRVFSDNGTAYFVMPFLGGKPLSQVISDRQDWNRPFAESELRALIETLLGGLEYIHDDGIFHRDIKPANILMVDEETPVLIDFGSARQQLSEKSMTVFESAGYTPFEQLQREAGVGPWTDIYSLAGTVYKAMTFETPMRSIDRVLVDPMTDRFVELRNNKAFTPQFVDAIEKGMSVDEGDRPQSIAEWRLLFDTPDNQTIPAAPPSPVEKTNASVPAKYIDLAVLKKKKPIVFLVAGGVGIVAFAALIGVIFFGSANESKTVSGGVNLSQAKTDSSSLNEQVPPASKTVSQNPSIEEPTIENVDEPRDDSGPEPVPVAKLVKPLAAIPLHAILLPVPPFQETLAADAEIAVRSFPKLSVVSRVNHGHKDWPRDAERLRQQFVVPNPFRNQGGNLPKSIPPKFNELLAVTAFFDAEAGYVIYGKDFSDGAILAVWDREFTKMNRLFDFHSFQTAPKKAAGARYINQAIRFAALRNGILYVSNFHNTYAKSSGGQNGYISAIDAETGRLIWRSKPLVCNSDNFLIIGDAIITGVWVYRRSRFSIYPQQTHWKNHLYIQSGFRSRLAISRQRCTFCSHLFIGLCISD